MGEAVSRGGEENILDGAERSGGGVGNLDGSAMSARWLELAMGAVGTWPWYRPDSNRQ